MTINWVRAAFAAAGMAIALPAVGQDDADCIGSGGAVLTMNDHPPENWR